MDEVGKLFECEKYFVRESLLPRRAVIGTVKSDLTGGAWVAMQFAHEVGADDHSDNASTAVALARSLTGVSPS